MTVKEYNTVFLPAIKKAEGFIRMFESSIEHMDEAKVDKNEVRKQFGIRGYDPDTMQLILDALLYYHHQELSRLMKEVGKNDL